MNPRMVVCLTVNYVDSCHFCVCNPLTWDTKDILWMDERVLIMIYESLAKRSIKCCILDTTWSPRGWLCGQHEIVHPRYLRRLTQAIRVNEILGQGSRNIKEGVPHDFRHASVLTWVID